MIDEFFNFDANPIAEIWQDITDFFAPIIQYSISFFESLPSIIQMMIYVLLFLAIIGILMSHIKGIVRNKDKWKKKPKSQLMFSYFCATGAMQRKLSYKDAHIFLRNRKWSWLSIAGLSYRLGILNHPSKVLLFSCSLLYLPAAILGFFEMVIRITIGTIYLLATSFIHGLILLGLRLLSWLLIPIGKMIDKSMRIDQHCPICYDTFNLPVFRCPECSELHSDLVPSVCGIMFARCNCGCFMASAAYSRRSRIDATCISCETDLVAANARQISIQLVGGNSSGKTAFLAAFQHLYLEGSFGIEKMSVYGKPQEYFDELESSFENGQTQSTEPSVRTYSFIHKVRQTGKHNLVIYDIPDEMILNDIYERSPRYLGFTDGILIIIDPLSVSSVRDECKKIGDSKAIANYSDDDVNELIVSFVGQFSKITGKVAKRQIDVPVAILINKVDVKVVKREIGLPKIKVTFNANPDMYGNDLTIARDELCRAYLEKLGLYNALNNLDAIFSNIRYFPISAIGHISESGNEFNPFGVIDPIAWIAKETNATIFKYINHVHKEEAK